MKTLHLVAIFVLYGLMCCYTRIGCSLASVQITCKGITSDASTVCSSNGVCVAQDTCDCGVNSKRYGKWCEHVGLKRRYVFNRVTSLQSDIRGITTSPSGTALYISGHLDGIGGFLTKLAPSGNAFTTEWTSNIINPIDAAMGTVYGIEASENLIAVVGTAANSRATVLFGNAAEPNVTCDYCAYIAHFNAAGVVSWTSHDKDLMVDVAMNSDNSIFSIGRKSQRANIWSWGQIGSDPILFHMGTNSYGLSIAPTTDSLFVAGRFTGTLFSHTAVNQNGFVARVSSSDGLPICDQRFGVFNQNSAQVIRLSKSGDSVFVAGFFSNQANFGSLPAVSVGDTDIFLVKMDMNCQVIWVNTAGGQGYDIASDLDVLSDGSVVVTGCFSGSASFSSHEIFAGVGEDLGGFIATYSDDGKLLNVITISSCKKPGDDDVLSRVHVSGLDNIFVSGRTRGYVELNNNITLQDQSFLATIVEASCFGIIWTDIDTVCAGHGECVELDICMCHHGWGGPDCVHHTCNNILSSSNDVCSSHGSCIAPDSCQCDQYWSGDLCQFTTCFGVNSSRSDQVCNGVGLCIGHNNCSCGDQWSGDNCQYAICAGLAANEDGVCSGRGNCSVPENCTCELSWTGSNCEHTMCNGISSVSNQVCSSHGNCSSFDYCECDIGFSGDNCEHNVCYGVSENQNLVCSGKGNCTSPNHCDCVTGYYGQICNFSICHEFPETSPFVCTGHGSCIAHDRCSCSNGWSGSSCSIPICNGVAANTTNSCGQETCTGPNNCVCLSNAITQPENCQDRILPSRDTICNFGPESFVVKLQEAKLPSNSRVVWSNATRVAIRLENGLINFYTGAGQSLTKQKSIESGDLVHINVLSPSQQSTTITRATRINSLFQVEEYDIHNIFNDKIEPLRGKYNFPKLQDFIPVRLFESKLIGIAKIRNILDIGKLNFDGCSQVVTVPSSLSGWEYPLFVLLELNSASLCVTRLLSFGMVNDGATEEAIFIPYYNGIIMKTVNTSLNRIIINHFDPYELLPTSTTPILLNIDPIVFPDIEAQITIDEKNRILLIGTKVFPLPGSNIKETEIPYLSSLNCGSNGHSRKFLRSFYVEGHNFYLVSNLCINTTTNTAAETMLIKFDGVHFVWNYVLNIPLPHDGIVDFYVDNVFETFHLLLSSADQDDVLYYIVQPNNCQYKDVDEGKNTMRPETKWKIIVSIAAPSVSVIACLFLSLVSAILWYLNKRRVQRKKDSMLHEKLLNFELSSMADDDLESQSTQLLSTIRIDIDELKFSSKISEGAYGSVFRGIWYNQDVAIKRLKVEDEDSFVREVSVLNCLRHPNILMLYGFSVDRRDQKYIITEYVDGGSLDDALSKRHLKKFDEKLRVLIDVAQGMTFLHSRENKIVHRDLKPQNILMKKDGTCKICDFGLSRIADTSLTIGVSYGTMQYMCPELLQQEPYDEKCDVYSFGVMMHEVFTLERPYLSNSSSSQLFANQFALGLKVIQGHRPSIPEQITRVDLPQDEKHYQLISQYFTRSNGLEHDNISPEKIATLVRQYFALCTRCWAHQATDRPNFETISTILQEIRHQL